jgi:hypothetical protein
MWSGPVVRFLDTDPEVPVRFPALPDFMRSSGSGTGFKKTEINGRGDSLRWPRDTLYPLKLALTSPTRGDRSVGIVRWRTKPRSLKYTIVMPFLRTLYLFVKAAVSVYILTAFPFLRSVWPILWVWIQIVTSPSWFGEVHSISHWFMRLGICTY